mgnify:CR=1 FL=1
MASIDPKNLDVTGDLAADDRIMKLSSNEVDMVIATMSITPQRQRIVDFSIPYHTTGQVMMVKSDSKITTLKELKQAIIVFGSTVEKTLRTNVPNITIIGYKTYPEAITALKADKGDAMIADSTILLGLRMNDTNLKILPKKYTKEPYAVAFRKGEESENLIEAVNIILKSQQGQIKELKNNEILSQLVDKYPFDIPASMLEAELNGRWNMMAQQFQTTTEQLEKIITSAGQKKEDMLNEWRPDVEKALKGRIIIEKLLKDKDISVADDEVDAEYAKIAENAGISVEEVKKHYADGQNKEYLIDDLKEQKLYKDLFEKIKVKKGEKKAFADLFKKN